MRDFMQEELEAEYDAQFDYITEAYAGMQEDPRTLELEAEAALAEWQAEYDAFIGPRQPLKVWTSDDIPF